MRKLYSTTNLARAISLGAAVATLLSSVSPVFAANLAITGQSVKSTDGPEVAYKYGSHGSVVLAGDNDFCGADNVVGRGGKQQQNLTNKITAEEQYSRFINDQEFWSRNPYGTTTESVTWAGDGATTPKGGYMGAITGGYVDAMPEAYGVYSFATGCGSAATGNYSTVFGAGATAKAGGAQAFGVSALASGKVSVAMGVGTEASGDSTVAIGGLSTALGQNSIALGTRARAEKNFAIALGTDAEAKGSGSIAIGGRRSDRTEQVDPNRKVRAEGENAIAIGSHTYAKTEDSVAIGANAQVLVNDGVAVGGGSVSDRDKGVVGYDPYIDGNSTEKNMVWKSTTGAFSVGEVGGQGQGTLTRQITGVAAGSQDTDAVNVAQLKAMKGLITEAGGGWKISVNDTDSTDVTPGSTVDFSVKNDNLKIEKASEDNKQKVKFALSDNLKLTGVTTGNASMSDDGFMFSGGASITVDGIHAGNKKIAGVEAGEDDTDAVNMAQLRAVQEAGKKVWQLSVNKGNATAVKSNDTVNFQAVGDEGKQNIKIGKNEDHDVTFALADNITVKSVTAGNASMSDDGFMFTDGGPSITVNGIDAGNKKITGVMAGTANTDAVNKAQLDNAVTDINNNINNSVINQMDKFAVLYDKNGDDSVNYNSVTLGGGKTNGQVALRNIKDGDISEESHDAINGSQINTISQKVAEFFGGGTKFENGVFRKPRYQITTIDENSQEIEHQEYNDVGSALSGLDMNIRHVNNHLIHAINDVADYFGGGAGYDEEGEWHAPIFKVIQFNANGAIKNSYDNVADAFEGVNDTFSAIHNQITNITENSLVKQDGEEGLITVGKATGGTKISIANKNGDARTISDVKDGTLSKASTEAVNGSQLFTINQNITNELTTIAQNTSEYFGGSTDVLEGIEPTFVINNEVYRNVTDAFTGVNTSIKNIDDKIIEMKENNLVQQDGVSNIITIGAKTAGTEINIAGYAKVARSISGVKAAEKGDEAVNKDQLDKNIEKISKDIEIASAAAVLYDKDANGGINYGSVTLGGDKGKGPVSLLNVKDGRITEGSTDAITGNQLYLMSNQLANYFGGGAKYENGQWTAPNFKISQVNADGTSVEKNYTTVAEAFDGINNGMSNINNRIDDVINKVDSDALKWNEKEGAYDANHGGRPSKITNVANGIIAENSKDAVNGGQLWETNERITDVENHVEILDKRVDNISNTIGDIGDTVINIENKVNDIAEDAVRYDRDENGKKTNKITLVGGDASEPVMIDNVADGNIETGSKEAVNGGQLHDYTQEQMKIILDKSKHYTDQRVNNIVIDAIDDAVERANNYTDMKFEALSYDINSVRQEARQAAAIGLAVSNLRYNDTPGKLSVAFGGGLWRNQSAIAFGAGYTSEKGDIRSNLSVTSSGGHWGIGAGLSLTLN
ncbi:Vomp family autotransporter [Bartonella doshiae]|uniref:Vomp family autotransporter n=1 Tax=Bartonella doshiae TaxID=33044 RepID=UPI0009425B00|nr:Vomp family autotransporter [Bartonella doshiae]